MFGVNLSDRGKDQAMFTWPGTHFGRARRIRTRAPIPFPVRVRQEFHAEGTQTLTRLVQVGETYRVSSFGSLNLRKSLYGYLGLRDLFSLIRFILLWVVPADRPDRDKKSRRAYATRIGAPSLFHRLREGYACGWCELRDGQLIQSAPTSPHPAIRRFSLISMRPKSSAESLSGHEDRGGGLSATVGIAPRRHGKK